MEDNDISSILMPY